MKTILRKPLYECEICHTQNEDMEYILKCESKGVPRQLVNVGDIVFFKDCEETPIMYGANVFDYNFFQVKTRCLAYTNKGIHLTVIKINKNGHRISYILGLNDNALIGWDFHGDCYPVVNGNELMKKILNASY